MRFDFITSGHIRFGPRTAESIPAMAAKMGSRVCLVTGGDPARPQWLVDGLKKKNLDPLVVSVPGEPDTRGIAEAAGEGRKARCDLVVAMGGGSVMDAGKAVAALLTNTRDLMDYLEVVGRGMSLEHEPARLIAVPTTAGTGSEVTSNAVLRSVEHGVKVSLRSPKMIPDIALIDPELTLSMPPEVTASTGMDALTQLMEAFVTPKANPLTSSLCREGMRRAARSLRTAYEDGADLQAREDMSLAALFSGMALSNAKLGAVHGLAAPIGGSFDAPHGAVCAALLPFVLDANLGVLKQREPDSAPLHAFREMAGILTGHPSPEPEQAVAWIKNLCRELNIPGLSAHGIRAKDLPGLAEQGSRSSSMQGNPVQLTPDELTAVLEKAL